LIAVAPVPHAKITIPPLPPEFVVRTALRAALDAGVTTDVTLVCAPAGYGKTLLLADWSRSSTAADTAWVSLYRDDNDPRRLWASIVAALAACPSVPRSSRLHDRWVWRADAQPEFLAELVEAVEAVPRPIRLILDDVHELVDPDAQHGVQILTRNHPAGMQLVLSSRLDPPLSLPRLRLAGRLRELRAAQLRFSLPETAALLEKSGVCLMPAQVALLHQRTGGWAAGLRLAAFGVANSADRAGFLTQFSGDERSVADYLVGEVLADLPEDVQEFLRVISISEPVPAGLAAELSGREDAGRVLDGLEHRTSLLSPIGRRRDAYTVQELLRTHLLADLRRQGLKRAAELHGIAARWWASRPEPVQALDHAAQSHDSELLTDLLHRFAVRLILAGHHEPLRRALASAGAQAVATDPWLALTSAVAHLEAGELPAARGDLRRAQQSWPADVPADLAVLRTVAEQLTAGVVGPAASSTSPALGVFDELPVEPELEALVRLSRGTARLERDDRDGARAEFEAALLLSRSHGFDYLTMQCLVLLGAVASTAGDVQTMRAMSTETVAAAVEHGWECSAWSGAATAMLAYAALLRTETAEAERLATEGLASGAAASPPQLRFALQAVHGAATFDRGDRAGGLAELQQARSEFGDLPAVPEQVAALAMLEFHAALLLGHSAAARTVLGWLANRTGENGELLMMRAWTDATSSRGEHARSLLRPVLDGAATALLPQSMVEAWLLETSLAVTAGERPAARRALQSALALAEPLDALRPFTHAGPGIRELLVHLHGSFGASDAFAERALAAGAGHGTRQALLSERELTVLGLLPSLLSLDEIAADLTVSVNTVKSHVRSIYTKLGVSSRRLAVLSAHEHGLLSGVRRDDVSEAVTGRIRR
jgi:LuxR family transcriptional regulator, maltose regulon positive regulatory protein